MIKERLRKLRFATLGLLILLLALSPVSSVFAVGFGHGFYGTVKVDGVDAGAGTVISAQVAGTEYGNWTVTTPGSYALIVQGDIDEGATIHFYVDGQEADQTFPFHDGWTTKLDLTVTTLPATYELTISSTFGGSVTNPGEGTYTYDTGTVVNLVASPGAGYQFVNWTGDVATIANVDAASTTITMQGDYSITANFEEGEMPSPFAMPCFIATAAYGTPTAEQIDVLREFRDVVLLESTVGSQFIALYYRLSPPIADFISGSSFLRTLVRELLVDPIVWLVEATGDMWRN